MFNHTPQFFKSGDGRFAVKLSAESIEVMVRNSATAGRKETGGILVGQYDTEGFTAIVVEATPKPKDSIFSWFSFRRGASGLKRLLENRWEHGLYYIGEWHYHPGGSSSPSFSDRQAMEEISMNSKYGCPKPVLVIIGGHPPESFEFSATVYPLGQTAISLLQFFPDRAPTMPRC